MKGYNRKYVIEYLQGFYGKVAKEYCIVDDLHFWSEVVFELSLHISPSKCREIHFFMAEQ